MPDSKENKQADAASRRFRKHFLCGVLLCIFFLQSTKVYLHMSNGNGQQDLLCPAFCHQESFVQQYYRDTNSALLLCVFCVFFPFILNIKFVGRTIRGHTGGRSHRISHPPSFWGVGVMCGWCLAYCTGVVLNTIEESAMPDSKENKQADAAGRRRFRRHFLCGKLLCNFLSTEHEGLSTHVQREWSAEPFMPSILSLRIFCTAVLSR